MTAILLSLASSVVLVVVAWRWTSRLPAWLRRLVCSCLVGLLCPPLFVQIMGAPFIPSIFLLTLGWNCLPPDDFKSLLAQWALTGTATFILWSAVAGLCSSHPENPRVMRRIRFAAVIVSLPAWVYITGLILHPILVVGTDWPAPNWFLIPGCLCFVCALVSMTLALITLRQGWSRSSDLALFIWSALPVCLGTLAGFFLWIVSVFDD